MGTVTDWDRIRLRAGPNSAFPGGQVYCYGSFRNMEQDWFEQFKNEAKDRGHEVVVTGGVVYILIGVVRCSSS